jgi:sporulation-control protein spo0M
MVFGLGEGKVDLILEKHSFTPGDVIKGKVVLELNQPKKAKELRVVLLAERVVYRSGKRRTQTVHRAPVVLDREKEYTSGEYNFEITLPQKKEPEAPGGLLGDVVKAASMFVGPSPLRWYVSAELDIPQCIN